MVHNSFQPVKLIKLKNPNLNFTFSFNLWIENYFKSSCQHKTRHLAFFSFKKQSSGFLNLFKTQVNKEGSPSLEKNNDKNRKINITCLSKEIETCTVFFQCSVGTVERRDSPFLLLIVCQYQGKSCDSAKMFLLNEYIWLNTIWKDPHYPRK